MCVEFQKCSGVRSFDILDSETPSSIEVFHFFQVGI